SEIDNTASPSWRTSPDGWNGSGDHCMNEDSIAEPKLKSGTRQALPASPQPSSGSALSSTIAEDAPGRAAIADHFRHPAVVVTRAPLRYGPDSTTEANFARLPNPDDYADMELAYR